MSTEDFTSLPPRPVCRSYQDKAEGVSDGQNYVKEKGPPAGPSTLRVDGLLRSSAVTAEIARPVTRSKTKDETDKRGLDSHGKFALVVIRNVV